ncbi:uncharacterized protein VP01_14807g1 [Puccinia sorghi]|uniref:Uncharacterized protein n=1 Tax=Puccinia sorghi TaxID=27349 RepID=A0A0L6VJK2_9BASI|nr:uncharacterized protein VP01_14807g1 [Puccinia sorghi]
MKDEETTSTPFNKATTNPLSGPRSAMDEDVKSDIPARALVALAYSPSRTKESNKGAAIAHPIKLLQSTSGKQVIQPLKSLFLPTLLEYGAPFGSKPSLQSSRLPATLPGLDSCQSQSNLTGHVCSSDGRYPLGEAMQ